jgi:hypothetical protein
MSNPLAEAESEFFLGIYRCAVESYQPRIEERTGVSLGNLSVWHISDVDQHILRDMEKEAIAWPLRWLRRVFPDTRLQRASEYLKSTFMDRARRCMTCYYNGGIYVSFEGDSRSHEEGVAVAVVHELTHAIWDKLAPKATIKEFNGKTLQRRRYQLLVEGYATYGEQVWFRDLYPPAVRDNLGHLRPSRNSVHYQGMLKIQELVERLGPAILLKLPAQWRTIVNKPRSSSGDLAGLPLETDD